VLRLAPNLPDPLVRLTPVLESGLDEPRQALPQRPRNLGGIAPELDVYRIQQHSPDVMLALVPRAVARPDAPGSSPSGQVVECLLGELALAADAVHDLQLELPVEVAAAEGVDDEAEVVDRLPAEAEPV
jgi:hypothetical protein